MDLVDAPLGRDIKVVGTTGNVGARLRLAELGIRVGEVVVALQRTSGGGRLLAVGACRIAVDSGTSREVQVAPLTDEDAGPCG